MISFDVAGAGTFAAKQAVATAGIGGVSVQALWDQLQPDGPGTELAAAAVADLNTQIVDARNVHLAVSFQFALHHPPGWVKSAVEPFRDQAGQTYTSGDPGKDVRDWVWTAVGRSYVLDFQTRTYNALTRQNRAAIRFVKFGGGYLGGIGYPTEFRSTPVSYWGFGAAPQTGTGAAAGLGACPLPGYTPFTGTDSQDVQWINWYLSGLEHFVRWQITVLQNLGFTCPLYAMHAGSSTRVDHTRAAAAFRENLACGHDFTRMVGVYKNNPQVWPWSTSINGVTAVPDSLSDSDQPAWAKLHSESAARGKHWRIGGENTPGDTNAGMDVVFGDALAPVAPTIGTPLHFGRPPVPWRPYSHLTWLDYTNLVAGPPHATLAHFAAKVAGYGPAPDALTRRATAELAVFTAWLDGQRGAITEFGVPSIVPAEQPAWNNLLEHYYQELDAHNLDASIWSSGRGWGAAYELGVYVNGVANGPLGRAQPTAEVVERHRSAGPVRATALSGWEFPVAGNGGQRDGYAFVHDSTDFAFLAARGVTTVRLGMMWERLQPVLGAALDAAALGQLDAMLDTAAAHNVQVILDLHNYCRWTTTTGTVQVLGGALSSAHVVDVWQRLAGWVRADPARAQVVSAYELMNEPHDQVGTPPGYSPQVVRYAFPSTVQGWEAVVFDPAVFRTAAGSIRATPGSGVHINGPGGLFAWQADGSTLSMWCRVDTAAAGDWDVSIQIQDTSYAYQAGPFQRLTKGQWTEVRWENIPAAYLTDHRRVMLYVGGSGRNGTDSLWIDDVTQGSVTGGVTGTQVWEQAAQAVVTALRTDGDTHSLWVATDNYSKIHDVDVRHPDGPWIVDPLDDIVYVGHHYLDTLSSRAGTFAGSYAAEIAAAVAAGYGP